MPNTLSGLADSLETNIGNLARAATTRHSNSNASVGRTNGSMASLPIPQPPQHTNVPSLDQQQIHRMSAEYSHSAPNHSSHLQGINPTNSGSLHNSSSLSNLAHRRNSQVNLSPLDGPSNNIIIEFEGGNHVIVRPNRIIRGKVTLTVVERIYVTRVRIKFRAEEIALVKIDEGGDNKSGDRLHETITTFFETDWKLWGNSNEAYSQAAWDELKPGKYEFPFALKFPNVNYPPSMEEPKGFSIRYAWTAQVDGPALQTGLKSREYLTPYRPIIVSTPDRQWDYKTKLLKDRKTVVAEVEGKLLKQSYCPDEPFLMSLNINLCQPDSRITNVIFKFRKHHEGKMLVQKGTAFKEHIRIVLQGQIPVTSSETTFQEDIAFDIPTRLVSPSFISHHTRVYYDIYFQVFIEHGGFIKTTHTYDFAVPITVANLPYDQLLRIPGLTSIAFYKNNKELPLFFDPTLDEPPEQTALPSELMGSIQAALLTSTPRDDPPNYFSIPTIPAQIEIRKERKEKIIYLTRVARSNTLPELSEALVIPGLFDESW
ncbi:hypothetical protein BDF20DRAFT_851601 [Mycotypha africana]|uniref:uncharacterized protein n=1 Tax=Mycotypha africana TaxID=64632 RepID=UPI0022FFDC4A|nr:uncharacterized protein BDF20DRAFT_851601 [Mycotypha africana]KAI8987678.1 hypothetical protein BDF20DRAFT_851601 [Mycotypha africana]